MTLSEFCNNTNCEECRLSNGGYECLGNIFPDILDGKDVDMEDIYTLLKKYGFKEK